MTMIHSSSPTQEFVTRHTGKVVRAVFVTEHDGERYRHVLEDLEQVFDGEPLTAAERQEIEREWDEHVAGWRTSDDAEMTEDEFMSWQHADERMSQTEVG
jgi:hypothetical protein